MFVLLLSIANRFAFTYMASTQFFSAIFFQSQSVSLLVFFLYFWHLLQLMMVIIYWPINNVYLLATIADNGFTAYYTQYTTSEINSLAAANRKKMVRPLKKSISWPIEVVEASENEYRERRKSKKTYLCTKNKA